MFRSLWVTGEATVVSVSIPHPGITPVKWLLVIDVQPENAPAFRTEIEKTEAATFVLPPSAGDLVPIQFDAQKQRAKWDYRAETRQMRQFLRDKSERSADDLNKPPGTPPT